MDVESLQQTKSVYTSDEFRLFCHKILPCSKRTAHDWASCPFAHPGEKAKRRNIRTHQYDCEMCEAVTKGEECKLGPNCPRAHNVFESWLHPQKYRTMMCKDKDKCSRPVCFFAHGPHELRTPTGVALVQTDVSHTASMSAPPAANAAAGNSASNWGAQSQQMLPQDCLARHTSTASAMSSSMAASGPSTPTGSNPALMGPAAGLSGAVDLSSLQLWANLMQSGNTAQQQSAPSAQHAQQQQQLWATPLAAGTTNTLPAASVCGSGLLWSQAAQSSSNTLLSVPVMHMMMPPQQQQRQASAELLRHGSAGAGCMVSSAQAGFTTMECSDASSSNMSDLSATLSLLTTEQVAQMYGTGVPLRSESVNSGAPLVWPPQLARSISAGTANGVLAQPLVQVADLGSMACRPMNLTTASLAHVSMTGSSQGTIAVQQPLQQQQQQATMCCTAGGQWYTPAATQGMMQPQGAMQAPATYMVASPQQAQMLQQRQQILLHSMPEQGATIVSSQAGAGDVLYFLN